MALDAGTLAQLMLASSALTTAGALTEYECYAQGVVQGLKLGTATVQTTGASGTPGSGSGVGAIQGGAVTMLPIVITNMVGIMPPPSGAPTPSQLLWFLSIAQIATYVLTALQVEAPPQDAVSAGVGNVLPGGFSVSGAAIGKAISLAYLQKGLIPTPMRLQVADAIGASTEQMMKLATMVIPIVGGVPSSPSSPTMGTRIGVIS
jgi:hypothetical protein